jgi:hypothetical protein
MELQWAQNIDTGVGLSSLVLPSTPVAWGKLGAVSGLEVM